MPHRTRCPSSRQSYEGESPFTATHYRMRSRQSTVSACVRRHSLPPELGTHHSRVSSTLLGLEEDGLVLAARRARLLDTRQLDAQKTVSKQAQRGAGQQRTTREGAHFFEECSPTPGAFSSSVSSTMPGAGSSPQSTQTISWPHMVQKLGHMSPRVVWERERERPTVGSWPTSCVTPAVSPTVDAISWRMTHDEGASSVKEQVRQANNSLFSALSSRGNRRLELQHRR